MMPNADAIALGKQIKAVRKAMGMTQDQLALKSHVSVKYIANIENGKQNPSFDILSAILHVLPLSLRRFTKGYYIKQPNMDCQPTEITALMRHRAVFS